MAQEKTKDYSSYHKIHHQDKEYIFDPYWSGIGIWRHYNPKTGNIGIVARRELQRTLNEIVFGDPDLPDMVDRFAKATKAERQRLRDISVKWLEEKVHGMKSQYSSSKYRTVNTFEIGHMYFYVYDAKYKHKLPVWDKFPLMIPIEMYPNGWLGLNLHFLEEKERAEILNNLIKAFGYHEGNFLKLNISYRTIRRLEYFETLTPCIKHYLSSHIQSRILPIEPHEWPFSIWLPVQDMQ